MKINENCLNHYSPLVQLSIQGEEGNTVSISPDNISRLLNVPLEDGEDCMKGMGL